jgi:hypothetical protein
MIRLAGKDKFLQKALPQKVVEPPKINLGLGIFMTAFDELTTCRHEDGLPIPWAFIDDYPRRLGMDAIGSWDLKYHVRQLDLEYLAWRRKKTPGATKPQLEDKSKRKPKVKR